MEEKKRKHSPSFVLVCSLIGVAALLMVYLFLIFTNALDSWKSPLVIQVGSAEKVYDGKPLSLDSWELVGGELQEGHTIEVSVSGERTDCGTSSNEAKVTVYDEEGKDVTSEYKINPMAGDLTVLRRKLELTSSGMKRSYNGEPLTSDEVYLATKNLLAGHTLEAKAVGSITDVGTTENTIVATVKDENGNDVSQYYEFCMNPGTLTVSSIPLQLTPGSREKQYDGTPLTEHSCTVKNEGAMMEGDVLEITYSASITDVGIVNNPVSVRVKDASGKDVTYRYWIETDPAYLVVLDPLYVGSKLDDLLDGKVEDVSGYLPGGDSGSSKEEKDPSMEEEEEKPSTDGDTNTPNEEGDGDASEEEKDTEDGEIPSDGELPSDKEEPESVDPETRPTDRPNENEKDPETSGASPTLSESGDLRRDGNDAENMEKGKKIPVLSVLAPVSQGIYLRRCSYGSYDPQTGTWRSAPCFSWENSPISPLSLTAAAMVDAGASVETIQIKLYGGQYFLPYYTVNAYNNNGNDVVIPYTEDVYTLSYIPKAANISYRNTTYSEYELQYRIFAYQNYTDVPRETIPAIEYFLKENGITRDDPDLINKVAACVRHWAVYDGTVADPKDVGDIISYFLTESRAGVCRHYASAATLIYRYLGIPARYTGGIVGNTVANEWSVLTANGFHAWTEVYLDGIGWVNIEVTGSGPSSSGGFGGEDGYEGEGNPNLPEQPDDPEEENPDEENPDSPPDNENPDGKPGDGKPGDENPDGEDSDETPDGENPDGKPDTKPSEPQPLVLELRPIDKTKVYDGEPLFCSATEYELKSGILLSGHTIYLTIEGSQTDAGTSESRITDCRVLDWKGKEVTDLYLFACATGKLTVTQRDLKITTGSTTKLVPVGYDGPPLTNGSYTVDGLLPTHTESVTVNGKQEGIGSSLNTVASVRVYDAQGKDVTKNYYVSRDMGRLSLLCAQIVIRTDSAQKVYDGSALHADGYEILSTELLPGHRIGGVYMETEWNRIGTVVNTPRVVVLDASGKDVSEYYFFDSSYFGKLCITPCLLTVTAASEQKVYDGTPLAASGAYEVTGTLVAGHTLRVAVSGELSSVGVGVARVQSVQVIDASGEDVSEYYQIKTKAGILQMTAS